MADLGCGWVTAHLARELLLHLAPSTVQRILHRAGVPRRRDRLALLEHQSASTWGLLTQRTHRRLARARGVHRRHVQATHPDDLVCLPGTRNDNVYPSRLVTIDALGWGDATTATARRWTPEEIIHATSQRIR